MVTVGQCRPLAKTVKFNVLEHQPAMNKVRGSVGVYLCRCIDMYIYMYIESVCTHNDIYCYFDECEYM